jgi:acyl-homoserine lactone acylase PvdQ
MESESGPQIEARALINLLLRENETWFGAHWWDDKTTAKWETREEILLAALRNALDYLEKELGTDMHEWTWGRIHTAEFGLTFEGFTIPSFLSPVLGPAGSDGGNFTVNVGNTYGLDEDFYNSHAPAARVVMEIDGDRFPTYAVLPGGQSERMSSPHFSDQFGSYLSGELLPVYYTLDEIVPNTAERILFTPDVD